MFTWLKKYIYWAYLEYKESGSADRVYDKIARDSYDKSVHYPKRVAEFKKIFDQIPIHKDAKVLDIACGTGAVEDALKGKSCVITGVDISSEMLAVARQRFVHVKNISFIQGSILDQTFPPHSFDLIVMAYATRFIPVEKGEEFATNVTSWLKPGGHWVCITSTHLLMSQHLVLFQKLTGFPKSFSVAMHTPRKIKELFASKLIFEKEIFFRQKLFRSVALIFRKGR